MRKIIALMVYEAFEYKLYRSRVYLLVGSVWILTKVVQERLGHSDISITLNTYSHVLPSMQEEAVEKMDEILSLIDVSNVIRKVGEPRPTFDVSDHEDKFGNHD